MNHGHRGRRKEIQTKGIHNLFNRIIAENFSNFKKERDIQMQDQKRNTPRHIIIKTLST
jgi:hypothetical protein